MGLLDEVRKSVLDFGNAPQIVSEDEFMLAWSEHDYRYALITQKIAIHPTTLDVAKIKAGIALAIVLGHSWQSYDILEPMTSRKHKNWRKQRRTELSFDEDVKEMLRDLSQEIGVSQSQIMQFFFLTGINNVGQARSLMSRYLEPSEAPMWQYRINFDRFKRDLGIDE